jgi:glucosyl-3-phosphoglycerate synthase
MTLPVPSPALRVSVIVPARNEEDRIAACLQALAAQEGVSSAEYEVLLVLDRCKDATERRAREVASAHPSLALHLLDGPGEGSGHARSVGMEAACARLLTTGRPRALIASTDADTVVATDWLDAQLAAVDRGSRAIGGRIELSTDEDVPASILRWHAERGRRRHERLLSDAGQPGKKEHWQFSGASLALTPAVYRKIGGLEPLASLEDEHLERVLLHYEIPIDRLLSVRVTTSARARGRAERGLSHDITRVLAAR